ncbi:MAG: GWxTD domain-containing protein, partial [bacterium]|nr:GWxTD domain-containing protein [bacterium]
FLVVLWVLPVGAGEADPARVDSLLAVAVDTSLGFDRREGVLKEAVEYDGSGRAMHALARFFIEKGSRGDAKSWLKQARRREPENADYLATDAELSWRGVTRRTSYRKAREALALDPNNVRALFWAGRYVAWSWEMMFFTEPDEEVSTRQTATGAFTGRTFTQRGYADLDVEVGIDLLSRALKVDPDHWPSRVHLGLVYYLRHESDRLVALFKEDLERHPDRRDSYFFMGLGYQLKDNLEGAYEAYVQGLAQMTRQEQGFMMSIFMLRSKKEEKKREPLPDEEELRKFWFGRDPLFMTPVNERLMEQCRRVAYVNLRFSDPANGYEGWQTDRGQAYIRYGEPLARGMEAADYDLGLDKTYEEEEEMRRSGQTGPSGLPFQFKPREETWSYDGFEVTFLMTNTWDSWRFGPAKLGEMTLNFSDLVEAVPDYYRYLFQYDVPYQVGQFRQGEGQTRVELYYALPGEKVRHKDVAPGIQAVDLHQALFLFDSAWDTLRSVVGQVNRMPWVAYESTNEGYLFASEQMVLDPGAYFLAGEAQDQETSQVGTFRDSLRVRRFGVDSLEISSLLMARRVVEREDAPMGRGRFLVLPNPVGQCSRQGNASFYFEVYNLARDEFGATHYRITYQVQALPEERVANAPEPEWTTAVSGTYRGSLDWEPQYLRLDMDGAAPGLRAFRVMVEDLKSGQQTAATTRFRVMW